MKIQAITIATCVLFLLHVLSVEAQELQFQLEIFVERYRNQDHRTAAGECCNGRGSNCRNQDCNNLFIFCTGPSGQASVDTGTCPYGTSNFTIRDDEFEFPFSTASPSPTMVPGSPNPIIFQGRDKWTGRFQLHVVVRNNNIQLVESFTRERSLPLSPMFTSRQRTNGNNDQAREIHLRYRVQCASNFYGPDCDIRCVPTDQFTCDSDGNIVCNEGYQNPANDCLDCASATSCDTTTSQGVSTVPTPSADTGNLGSLGTGSSSSQTTALNPALGSEQQDGLSQGGVAGVVIAVLIIVVLVGGGVAIGIVLWVHQPWSNGWFGVEEKLRKMNGRSDAISNPVYEQTEIDSSQNAEAPVPVRGVKYTPITNSGGAAENGGQVNLNMLTRSLDDDNPLYASSALERILSPRDAGGTRSANGILQEELTRGMGNGHVQSNVGAASAAAGPKNNIAKIATLRESGSLEHILMSADVRDLTKPSKPQSSGGGPPPVPMKPKIQLLTHRNSTGSLPRAHGTTQDIAMTSFLVASQSLDNLLGKPEDANFLNPYGDYGDKTLQRVVSGHSMNEAGEECGGKTAKDDQMFDNPDYECVNIDDDGMESDQPKDIDYEEI